MKKISISILVLISIVLLSSSFKKKSNSFHHSLYRGGGPAASGGAGRTGAPFNTSNCSGNGSCHDGGTYLPTFNVELLDNTNAVVTNYIAGALYTLRISIVATDFSAGTPLYGFQTTSVKASNNANLNTWGASMPLGVNNFFLTSTSRNYVEHNAPRTSGIINIPWTAPAANYGTVRFYTAGNAVDGNSDPSNDSPTGSNVLTIGETVLPVSLLAFTAKQTDNTIILNWKTAQEINNDYFLVEHSTNGTQFSSIGKVKGNGNSSNESLYSFIDKNSKNGRNFYRLAQTDFSGKVNYSSIVEINYNAVKDFLKVSPNPIINEVIVKTNFNNIGSEYSIVNSNGIKVLSGLIISDKIDVHSLAKGNYFIKIKQANGNIISCQFVK
jgi:Secretion system C-terminal sorting domain